MFLETDFLKAMRGEMAELSWTIRKNTQKYHKDMSHDME